MNLQSLNTNPYFIGCLMLVMNLGGRFLSLELSKSQEAILSSTWTRRFLLFTVLFVATRNVLVAFVMSLVIWAFLAHLLNEKSPYCIIPRALRVYADDAAAATATAAMQAEEAKRRQSAVQTAARFHALSQHESAVRAYQANLGRIRERAGNG
jgi:hypothetical protein